MSECKSLRIFKLSYASKTPEKIRNPYIYCSVYSIFLYIYYIYKICINFRTVIEFLCYSLLCVAILKLFAIKLECTTKIIIWFWISLKSKIGSLYHPAADCQLYKCSFIDYALAGAQISWSIKNSLNCRHNGNTFSSISAKISIEIDPDINCFVNSTHSHIHMHFIVYIRVVCMYIYIYSYICFSSFLVCFHPIISINR